MFQTRQDQGAFLELAQAAMGLGWWIADSRPGGRLTASPEARRIFGLTAEGFDGTAEAFWSLIHPEDSARILAAVAATLRDHAPFRAEHRILTASGSVRYLLMSAVADPGDPGLAPRLLGICQDITERHRMEDEIRAAVSHDRSLIETSPGPPGIMGPDGVLTQTRSAESALRESEERLRAIFENAPVAIDDRSPDGEFVRVNPRFCQLTGYTAEEMHSLRSEDLVHPDDLGADIASTQRLLAGAIDSYSLEKRYLRKGGGIVWVEVKRALVRADDGRPLLLVGVARDITGQRRAEAEVRALNADLEGRVQQRTAELQRLNKDLQAFSYSVSHDLRAPLRTLTGFTEVLLEEYGAILGEAGRGYAYRIQSGSARMSTLIDDLLKLAHVSQAEVNLSAVNLSAEADAIVAELKSGAPERRVRWHIQDAVWAEADHTLIRTVLQNLLENAWKFTSERDDATIEFATTDLPDEGRVCCFVRDNGAGFDAIFSDQLFRPFQRLHAASQFPGTGIGLASVRQIVERHGGQVWAQGREGEGATFYFTLPPRKS